MRFVLLGLLLLSFCNAVGQTSDKADSLFVLYNSARSDTAKARLALKLSQAAEATDIQKSEEFAYLSLQHATDSGDSLQMAKTLNSLGIIEYRKGNLIRALAHYRKSFSISETIGFQRGMASCTNNIGIIYQDMFDIEQALNQYREFVRITRQMADSVRLATGFFNLVIINSEQGFSDSANHYLKLLNELDPVFTTQGNAYDRAKAAVLLKNGELDLAYFHLERWRNEWNPDEYHMIEYFIMAAKIQEGLGDFKSGLKSANRAVEQAEKFSMISDLIRISEIKARVYGKMGDFERALNETSLHMALRDSMNHRNNIVQVREMFNQYESAILEKEIIERDRIIEQQDAKRKNMITIGLILMVAMLVVVGISVVFTIINKRKKEMVDAKNREIEKQRMQIIAGITYAEKIQKSMLTPVSLIQSEFPGSFVYQKPKDIVSGDFYWMSRNNGYVFVAVADCTGHGVPGAMMSMIGHSTLVRVIRDKNLTDPAEILGALSEEIDRTLYKTDDPNAALDGMDISLVRIEPNKREIVFAGACQSVYLSSEGVAVEYKGAPFSLGGHKHNGHVAFENNRIEYRPGNSLIMFTDGYRDQFKGGGEQKFGKAGFEEVITRALQIPGEEFVVLDTTFESWKSDSPQIDDVLVVGIRL